MQRLQNISDRLLASLTLFTRLPWWRIRQIPTEAFHHAVEYWPFAGWITGGISVAIFAVGIRFMPLQFVVILMLAGRLLLTGALHEDGLADFCDGMGGGTSRERILQIMKDSHIGTYGVIGLILYTLFIYNVLTELPMQFLKTSLQSHQNPILLMCATVLTADVWGKSCASLLVSQLPYSRRQEDAKTGVVYTRLHIGWHILRMAIASVPVIVLWTLCRTMPHPIILAIPLLTEALISLFLRRKIGGYTGDCCGATFLLCEASIYIGFLPFR